MKLNSIKTKLIIAFALIVCIQAGSTIISFWLIQDFRSNMENLTGPVRSTEIGVAEGVHGILKQIHLVELRLNNNDPQVESELKQRIEQSQTTLNEVFNKVVDTQQLDIKLTQVIDSVLNELKEVRTDLFILHNKYSKQQAALNLNVDSFQNILVNVEKIASQNILFRDINAEHEDQYEEEAIKASEDSNEEDADYEEEEEEDSSQLDQDILHAASEARTALLSRLYQYAKLLKDINNTNIIDKMNISFEDISYAVELINESLENDKPHKAGQFQGKTNKEILSLLLNNNKKIIDDSISDYKALQKTLHHYEKVAKKLTALGKESTSFISEKVENTTHELRQVSDVGLSLLLSSSGIGMFVIFLIYIFMIRSIITPLKATSDQLWTIADGEGNLKDQLPTKNDYEIAHLADGFNAFTAKLTEIVLALKDSINQLSTTTIEVSTIGNRTENEVQNQQVEIDQLVHTMSELNNSIQSVAEMTKDAFETAASVDTEVHQCHSIVFQTINSIEQVVGRVTDVSTSLNDLDSHTSQIGTILGVIQQIAEQTNLLALNAAIEAARAGEAGRGFAVVADEVRNLAARTSDSIIEIEEYIKTLQQGTSSAISAMNNAVEMTENMKGPSSKAGTSLEGIKVMISKIKNLNETIASSTQIQSSNTHHILEKSEKIRHGANETLDSAVNLSDSTTGLITLAERFNTLATYFKTEGTNEDPNSSNQPSIQGVTETKPQKEDKKPDEGNFELF